jgi:hypothetical protein
VGDSPDAIIIQLLVLMTDKNSGATIMKKFYLSGSLPMLISSAQELQKLTSISNTFGDSSRAMFYAYLAINLLFSFAMGMLWGTF